MSPDTDRPVPYHVSLSGRVYHQLLALGATARARGDGEAFVAAVREFYHRLQIYPQFGDLLSDLRPEPGHIGLVYPLAMRYGVLEESRQVFVAALPVLMPRPRASEGG